MTCRTGVILFLLLSLMCWGCNHVSNKAVLLQLEDKIELAETILLCKASQINKRWTGENIVTLESIKVLKGELKGHSIEIYFKEPILKEKSTEDRFSPNKEYILFLMKHNDGYKILYGFQGYHPITDSGLVMFFCAEPIPMDIAMDAIERMLNRVSKNGFDCSTIP